MSIFDRAWGAYVFCFQEPLILYGQKVTPPENKCNKKYSFQLTGSRCDILLAAETAEWRTKWMNALGLAAIGYKVGYNAGY